MSLFDIIKYQLSDPPRYEEIDTLPKEARAYLLDKTAFHSATWQRDYIDQYYRLGKDEELYRIQYNVIMRGLKDCLLSL